MRRVWIDSPRNDRVKELVRLRERRERERRNAFLIEGTRELERATQAGVEPAEVFLAPEVASVEAARLASRLEEAGWRVTELSAAAFTRASLRENPDGIVAVARSWESQLAGLQLPAEPLTLVLDGVEKPGNVGALLRTADAVDAAAVFVTGSGTDPFNPNVVRASMGSLFSRPLVVSDAGQVREFLAGRGVRLVATTPHAAKPYWDANLSGPLAVLVGEEHQGLDEGWLQAADERVAIPMHGLADSLNVATAGALVLYEALRQRRLAPRPGEG